MGVATLPITKFRKNFDFEIFILSHTSTSFRRVKVEFTQFNIKPFFMLTKFQTYIDNRTIVMGDLTNI